MDPQAHGVPPGEPVGPARRAVRLEQRDPAGLCAAQRVDGVVGLQLGLFAADAAAVAGRACEQEHVASPDRRAQLDLHLPVGELHDSHLTAQTRGRARSSPGLQVAHDGSTIVIQAAGGKDLQRSSHAAHSIMAPARGPRAGRAGRALRSVRGGARGNSCPDQGRDLPRPVDDRFFAREHRDGEARIEEVRAVEQLDRGQEIQHQPGLAGREHAMVVSEPLDKVRARSHQEREGLFALEKGQEAEKRPAQLRVCKGAPAGLRLREHVSGLPCSAAGGPPGRARGQKWTPAGPSAGARPAHCRLSSRRSGARR